MQIDEVFRLLDLENRKQDTQVIVHGGPAFMILCSEAKRCTPRKQAPLLKERWRKHLATHPSDFNGRLLSVKEIVRKNGEVMIRCRATKFSEFVATRGERKGKRLEVTSFGLDAKYPLPLSFGMIARTTDRHVVVGIRGDTAFGARKATFLPGGYVDFTDERFWLPSEEPRERIVSLEREIWREMREEMPGIRSFTKPKILGLVHSLVESCQPAIIGRIDIPHTAKEVMKICGDAVGGEVEEIVCVPDNIRSLREFAKRYELCIHDVYKIAFYLADTCK